MCVRRLLWQQAVTRERSLFDTERRRARDEIKRKISAPCTEKQCSFALQPPVSEPYVSKEKSFGLPCLCLLFIHSPPALLSMLFLLVLAHSLAFRIVY